MERLHRFSGQSSQANRAAALVKQGHFTIKPIANWDYEAEIEAESLHA